MEENKELETTTEEQASVTPAANDGEKNPQHHDHEG